MNTIKTMLCAVMLLAFTVFGVAQEGLTTTQWQADVDFLKEEVHSNFPFLFKKVTAEEWDAAAAEFRNAIPNLESHEIKVGFSKMVAMFKYGHTQVPFSTLAKYGVLPVNLYHFKDGVYVEGTTKAHEKINGAKVLSVGAFSVEEALAMIRPVVPVENDSYFKAYGIRFLGVPAVLHAQGVIPELGTTVEITVEKEGNTFTYALPQIAYEDLSRDYNLTKPNETWISARSTADTPLYLQKLNDTYFNFEYLPDSKTLYVRQSSVFDHETETIAEFYQRLFAFADTNEISKFIYDVRLNGGGNNYNNKGLIQGILARPELNIEGKFFFIIGRQTFSACQNLTNEIENYTNAIMVGEPTAENKNFYGDNKKVTLPNSKINMYLSFAWWQDLPQWENADATFPIIGIEPTFEEYQNNQDPVLEFILTQDMSDIVTDPMEHFTQLFMQGKVDQLRTDAARILSDPLYAAIPFDVQFMKAAENLEFQGQHEGALLIYQLLTESYPEHAEVWSKFAHMLEVVGQTEAAQQARQKAELLGGK
ncbi:hypothetical protein GCM10011414_13870 [Croceivirga lutea]|uniref:hypothetical protein n=1 Tax=Croceivirga lutea TaxID=1775167 RepID=UPI00163A293A|nr:hypothetical protein [Croceivirga lutea]GGG45534.1 hypothetical protein GCM10011414_13870 [Croceivirga lutea]